MFVGRPFLLSRPNPGSNNNSPSGFSDSQNPASGNNHKQSSTRQQLVEDCVQAAKEALEICRSLRDGGYGLARGSYIEYSSCRASLLVLIAYCVYNESSDEFQNILQDGLGMIRYISAAGDSARSEVALIEALEGALKSRNDGSLSASGSLGSSYDTFKHWELMWKNGGGTRQMRSNLRTPTTANIQPRVSTSIWGSPVTSNLLDHPTYDWPTNILSHTNIDNFFVGSDHNLGLQFMNDSESFRSDSLPMAAEGNTFMPQSGSHAAMQSDFDFDFEASSI
jgi:hypothetical protein